MNISVRWIPLLSSLVDLNTSLRLRSFGIVQIRVSDRYHLDLGTSRVFSIQQKFLFEILEI